MRIILARHCRTEWNAKRLIQGHSDIPLDDVGFSQARELASSLAIGRTRIGLIISSDLLRARQTAEFVQAAVHAPIVLDERLREARFGDLDGMTYEQYDATCGERNLRTHPNVLEYDFRPFGGEAAPAVLDRMLKAVRSAVTCASAPGLLVVSHGRALRTLFYHRWRVNRHFENGEHVIYDDA